MRYALLIFLLGFVPQAYAEEEIPTIAAYQLVKNPFLLKNKKVLLDPMLILDMDNGRIVKIKPNSGLVGIRFDKMIDENVAVYDVLGLSAETFTYLRDYDYVGQLLVVLSEPPNADTIEPLLYQPWVVEPLGQMEVSNALGNTMFIPTVKFLNYEAEAVRSARMEAERRAQEEAEAERHAQEEARRAERAAKRRAEREAYRQKMHEEYEKRKCESRIESENYISSHNTSHSCTKEDYITPTGCEKYVSSEMIARWAERCALLKTKAQEEEKRWCEHLKSLYRGSKDYTPTRGCEKYFPAQ